MGIEEIIDKILTPKNLKLNNFFQLKDGTWRANIVSYEKNEAYEFGDGKTLIIALEEAINKVNSGKFLKIKGLCDE